MIKIAVTALFYLLQWIKGLSGKSEVNNSELEEIKKQQAKVLEGLDEMKESMKNAKNAPPVSMETDQLREITDKLQRMQKDILDLRSDNLDLKKENLNLKEEILKNKEKEKPAEKNNNSNTENTDIRPGIVEADKKENLEDDFGARET